jgi:hypothetical protein
MGRQWYKRTLWVVVAACAPMCAPILSGSVAYTCAANIDATEAGTCAYLNTTIAGLYNSTFSNMNADFYIEYGVTGLGSNSQYVSGVSYSSYLDALTSTASSDAVDTGALASLPLAEPSLYDGGNVYLTSTLGGALGFTGIGIDTSGGSCTLGTGGCYNDVITITTPANLSSETSGTQSLYWRQAGGSIPADAYDFYSVVEHETDEALGTASCITTTGALADFCGGSSPSAVDLFRYSAGARVLESTTPGAYFSYDGGVTNGAAGAVYNTLPNGEDYADYVNGCQFVQDEEGCTGRIFDITTDGGSEINILDAVGFNLNQNPVPEPGTVSLLSLGFAGMAAFRLRRRG